MISLKSIEQVRLVDRCKSSVINRQKLDAARKNLDHLVKIVEAPVSGRGGRAPTRIDRSARSSFDQEGD
jgi:hypothetical protein